MNNVNIMIKTKVEQSYEVLEKLRLPNGMYYASPSSDYRYTWIRDSVYISLPYLNKKCNTFEKTIHRLFEMFKEYEFKLDYHTKHKPVHLHEYIHSRFTADTVQEIHEPWGHHQIDALSLFIWAVAEGIKHGKNILRDDKDKEIIQKLVWYFYNIEVWHSKDNSIWEENLEVHSNSIGAAISALKNIKNIVYVPEDMIQKCEETLNGLFPFESETKAVDLSQLALIFPFKTLSESQSRIIIDRVERYLVRERGIIRYQTDSYYSTLEDKYGRDRASTFYLGEEAEWCFGFGFLSLAYQELGDLDKAKYYIEKLENVMLPDGSIPELYYSKTNKWNVNTPLAWSNSMYILAKEKYESIINKK